MPLQGAGLTGASLAAAYHHSRDVFPHNPRRRVIYVEGGTVYFHPDSTRYDATPLKPRIAAEARDLDPLATLASATRRRGMSVAGWVVFLHNTRLAFEQQDCAPLTAFGDRLLNYLCPAHPEVRAYARALAGDIGRYGVDSIKLEALSYMPFDHGYHHERSFIHLSPNIRFLLGLCFCAHCLENARSAGVDGERVRRRVTEVIGAVLESARHETAETTIEEQELRAEADGELGRYLDARHHVVTSLVEEVSASVHAESPDTRVLFLDGSGASLGYATGRPITDLPAVSIAWRDGVDLLDVARAADGLVALAYFADLDRFEREVAAYYDLLPTQKSLEVVLRPMLPDAESPRSLADKVTTLRRLGVADIAFYHYGFMRLESLEWIASALAATGSE